MNISEKAKENIEKTILLQNDKKNRMLVINARWSEM